LFTKVVVGGGLNREHGKQSQAKPSKAKQNKQMLIIVQHRFIMVNPQHTEESLC
jgi:hypothetical protein